MTRLVALLETFGDDVGDPSAAERPPVEALYRDEGPRLLRYFARRVDHAEAHDLVHETFADFLGAAARHRQPIARPAAYLQRIARNLLIDRARRRAGRAALHVPLGDWDREIAPDQEQALIASDTLRLYEDAIADLPERTRTMFLMNRAQDMTYRAIAAHLGVTLWTVEHHMKRALAHLDRRLGEP